MNLPELTAQVEEVSALYASRHGFHRDDVWFLLKLQEEVGELTQAFMARSGQARSKGRSPGELDEDFRSELADVLAHVLLLARHFDVDVAAEIDRKWLVWTRGATTGGALRHE